MSLDLPSCPAVVLVRHAETEWSRSGRHTGSTDIPITEAGRRSLGGLRERLADQHFGSVLVSPLLRARQTCEELGFADALEVREDLAEWRYGRFEGLTAEQIEERSPGWDLWHDGAPGGESPEEVARRVDRIVDELDAMADRVEAVLIIAHGHALRAVGTRWIGLPIQAGGRLRLGTGAVSVLGWHRGVRVVRRWNIP